MATYRAHEATGSGGFRLVERPLVAPEPGHVRIRVHSCGICHSDSGVVDGSRADPDKPIVPGHELVGHIEELGAGVTSWPEGTRVGVGLLGGQCWLCNFCRRGDFVNCDAG